MSGPTRRSRIPRSFSRAQTCRSRHLFATRGRTIPAATSVAQRGCPRRPSASRSRAGPTRSISRRSRSGTPASRRQTKRRGRRCIGSEKTPLKGSAHQRARASGRCRCSPRGKSHKTTSSSAESMATTGTATYSNRITSDPARSRDMRLTSRPGRAPGCRPATCGSAATRLPAAPTTGAASRPSPPRARTS